MRASNGELRFPHCLFKPRVLPGVCLLALLLVLNLPLPGLASEKDTHRSVSTLLDSEALQGAVWATVDAGGTVAVGAAGIKDARTGASLRPDDRVQVGSIAKTILATGVLRLVSQGGLSLDARVSALLPDVAFKNRWEGSDPVRVRHLLDHTAGLEDARFFHAFSLKPGPDTPLAEGFAMAESLLRVRNRPGTRFSYSNLGYTLLGRIIESVTGERYENYLHTHLLQPLGMHDSSLSFVTQTGPLADPRLAMGHFEHGVTQAAMPTYVRPAGQFTTTAADMGKLARFLMGDGRIGGQVFIAPPLLKAMGKPNGTEAANAGLKVGHGLGLRTTDRQGAIGECHSGSTVGYRATLCMFPQEGKAYFIAFNTDSETANHGRFEEVMLKALALGPRPTEPASGHAFDSTSWEGYYIPAPNRFASFAWLDMVFNFAHLRRERTGLRFTPFQSAAVDLTHVGGQLFRANGRVSASHVLLTASTGEQVISTGTQNYEKVSPMTLGALWVSLLIGLLGLAYILVSGLARIAMRRMCMSQPLLLPFAGIVAVLLSLPLFFGQSFIELGDLTLASGALAGATGMLPVTMLAGLVLGLRTWPDSNRWDLAAMLGVLQLTLVLAAWGLVPFRLWA